MPSARSRLASRSAGRPPWPDTKPPPGPPPPPARPPRPPPWGEPLRGPPALAVHDAALGPAPVHEGPHLLIRPMLRHHAVEEIRPVEAPHMHRGVSQAKLAENVLAHALGS